MVYLKKGEQQDLTFLTQTWLSTFNEKFILDTACSSDVDAKFKVTSEIMKRIEPDEPLAKRRRQNDQQKTWNLYSTSKSGIITVVNRKKEDVTVRIEVTLFGTVADQDNEEDAKDGMERTEKMSDDPDNLNPENLISWNLQVLANESKEIRFGYNVRKWDNLG
jgi:hypothetical protein